MSAIMPLPPEDANVVLVPMLNPSRAVDLWLGDLARRGYSPRTIATYRDHLDRFCDVVRDDADVTDIRADDCRRHLDRWNRSAQGTRAHAHSVLNSFLEWLYLQQRIKTNPLDHVPKPRRIRPEDLDVVTVRTPQVPALLAVANVMGWPETLAVAIVAYLGPRRHAAALLRLADYDRETGRIRFREKGRKTIWKPVPDELAQLLDRAIAAGVIREPTDYLIPAQGTLIRQGDRDDRVIWRLIRKVADAAGVEAHVHALRAAFACFYLEQHPNDLVGLQELMGHKSIETTKIYLRKLDKQRAMEPVRTLSWAGVGSGNVVPLPIPANSGGTIGGVLADGGERIRTSVARVPASAQGLTDNIADALLDRAAEAGSAKADPARRPLDFLTTGGDA